MTPFAAADPFGQALSGLTGGLQGPVHAIAVALLALLALEAGKVATEAWRRIRPSNPGLQEVARRALADPVHAETLARAAPGPLAERTVVDLAHAAAGSTAPDAVEHALADYELRIQRRLDRTRMLVRAGPALGLMGTLIPLAPGLAALGDGDFAKLAGDLQIAFAATVVGIVIGTGAFALTLFRTRVYTEDLAALERAVAAHAPGAPPHQRVAAAVGDRSA
jgi:biopolymer transport protein ExbB/TolQ